MARRKAKVVRKARKAVRVRVQRPISRHEAMARGHAEMVANPCHAPLVATTYLNDQAGMLGRYVGSYNIVNTNGFISVSGDSLTFQTADITGTPSLIAPVISNVIPGVAALQLTHGFIRCVAACVSVTYVGSTLEKKGLLAWGHSNSSQFSFGGDDGSVNIDLIMSCLSNRSRLPDSIEAIWVPTKHMEHPYTQHDTAASTFDKGSDVTPIIAWRNVPAGSLTVHLTTILEAVPRLDMAGGSPTSSTFTGFMQPSLGASADKSVEAAALFRQYIRPLFRSAFRFARRNIGPAVGAMASEALHRAGPLLLTA